MKLTFTYQHEFTRDEIAKNLDVAPTDPRLTDAICDEYVKVLVDARWNAPDYGFTEYEQMYEHALLAIREEMGL